MTSEDVDKIVRAIDRASLTISASILMASDYCPHGGDVAYSARASDAILTARALLHDAVSSAFVLNVNNGGAV